MKEMENHKLLVIEIGEFACQTMETILEIETKDLFQETHKIAFQSEEFSLKTYFVENLG